MQMLSNGAKFSAITERGDEVFFSLCHTNDNFLSQA